MIEKNVTIVSSLEARPAALLVQTAGKFSSEVKLQIDNKTANAKSIMGVISLGILEGNVVTLLADGKDETQAVSELERFLRMM